MPIVCIDLGSKKTGIAISYDPFIVAESLPTIFHSSEKELLNILLNIIDSKKVSKIIFGLPLGPKGAISKQSENVKRFANLIDRDIEKIFIDESLTSKIGEKYNSEDVDSVSAKLILQEYLSEL